MICLMCGRPLPPRKWWHLITPPPFHDPRRYPECVTIMRDRIARGGR